MLHLFRPLVGVLLVASFTHAADPTPIDKSLAIQRAMAEAKTYLTANQPADAVKSLEGVLPSINGDADFLVLLRQAYGEELKRQKVSRTPDNARVAELESKLTILTGSDAKPVATETNVKLAPPMIAEVPPIPAPAKPTAESVDLIKQATDLFNQARAQPAKFAEAARFFDKAFNSKLELSRDQMAAWAYCRVKLAADGWNKSNRDASATKAAVREIEDALKLAPAQAELQAAGLKIIADIGGTPTASTAPTGKPTITESSWMALESDNFRVRFQGSPDVPKALLTKAEEGRRAIFAKWSSPPSGNWQPKCDIVLHADGKPFAIATNQPAEATGHAFVKLEAKQVTDRRIDLRADDANVGDETLARELTYVILADLFPDRDLPRWAAIGMAVLSAASETERCQQTLPRCQRDGELFGLAAFLDLKGPPKPEAVTAYYVESVSLVDHLVHKKNEKTFRIFLLDAQRYGTEKALERQYGYATVKELDDEWRRAALTTARGQKP
ncbi:hypothetical protein [Limnoglobus roseus]|uniref:Uncharacterized protein n=1 Tax=Limnoglobus roseus TaxID=2598579 RepID=A0A5C1AAN1_9BACT|nr:hypothetical protein [Limnoglobus roseus]QEL15233.1 hypothetical protein PX52LOC_02148 [Limnoglobus roseus]